jgi:hypothetical protein
MSRVAGDSRRVGSIRVLASSLLAIAIAERRLQKFHCPPTIE